MWTAVFLQAASGKSGRVDKLKQMSRQEVQLEESTGEHGRDLSRIIGLSDGVFGFALTLLASGIGIPAFVQDVAEAQLTQEILALVPEFLVYAIAFYFVIFKWMVHRRIFAVVVAYDTKLIWLNNLFLLMIAFMPVPSKIMVKYPDQAAAVVFFAMTYVVTTFIQYGLWTYITRTPALIRAEIEPDHIRSTDLSHWVIIAAYLLSIAIAIFISPFLAIASWILIGVISGWMSQRMRRRNV